MATLFNTKIKDTYQSLLKLEDNTILTTTVKNVTDGLGNASPLYMSTTRIGIGTNAPSGVLHITSTEGMGGNNGGQIALSQSGANFAVIGIQGSGWNTFGIWGISRYSTSAVPDLRIFASGIVSVYNNSLLVGAITTSTAKFQVRGGGSSSATTALIVDNSSGTAALTVKDDLSSTFGGNVNMGGHFVTNGSGGLVIGLNGAVALPWVRSTSGTRCLMAATNNAQVVCDNDQSFFTGFNTQITSGSRKNFYNVVCNDFSGNNNLNDFTTAFSGTLSTNTFNHIALSPTGAPGSGTPNYRGIYINPSITGFASITAFENTTGNVLLGTTSGNVGIGTSSPTEKLDVVGNIKGTSLALTGTLQGTGTGDNYLKGSAFTIQSAVNNTNNSFYISTASLLERKVLFLAQNLGSYGRSDLYLCINGDATATNASITDSKVVFKANGNVLIGTTTDAGYKLDVNGTARVSGDLNITNGNRISFGAASSILIGNNSTVPSLPNSKMIAIGDGASVTMTINYVGDGVAIGAGSLVSGVGVAIGGGTKINGGVAIRTDATGKSGTFINSVFTGANANDGATVLINSTQRNTNAASRNISIGINAGINDIAQIGFSSYIPAGLPNTLSFGSASDNANFSDAASTIQNIYFGSGVQRYSYLNTGAQFSGNGASCTINGSGAYGTDFAGGNITIAGGKGTGAGTPGNLIFATAIATTTGTTLQTLVERMRINGSGNVMINTSTDSGYKLNVNGTAFVSELITTGGLVKHNPYTVGVKALEIYSNIGHGGNTGVWASMYARGVYGNGWDSYYGTQGIGVAGDPNNTSDGGSVLNIGVYGGATSSNATGVYGTSGLFGKAANLRNASAALEVNSTTHGFLPPRMTAAQRSALNTITGFGVITGGSGYVDGIYRTVSITGGSGQNAYARIVISGGSVTSVTLDNSTLGDLAGGFGYTNGASVSASNTQLGGTGAGFSVIINASTPVGMMVYQTDATEGLYIYKSTGWTFIA